MLKKNRQNEIDSIIDGILLQAEKTYPEDNLEDIIESYDNICMAEYDFKDDSSIISGAIAYTESGKTIIYINKVLSPTRKTFTLAHEFGHFILHNGQNKFRLDFVDRYNNKDSHDEAEANYFAASLLMPKERFLRACEVFSWRDDLIARFFGVSVIAVRVRRKWLKQN